MVLFPLSVISMLVLCIKRVQVYHALCGICYYGSMARKVSPITGTSEEIGGIEDVNWQPKKQRIRKLNQRFYTAWELLREPLHILDSKSVADFEAILTEFGVSSPEKLRSLDQEGLSRIASCLKIEPKNSFIELMDERADDSASDDSSSDSSVYEDEENQDSDTRKVVDMRKLNDDSGTGNDRDIDLFPLGLASDGATDTMAYAKASLNFNNDDVDEIIESNLQNNEDGEGDTSEKVDGGMASLDFDIDDNGDVVECISDKNEDLGVEKGEEADEDKNKDVEKAFLDFNIDDNDDIFECISDKNEDGGVEKGEEEDEKDRKTSLDFDIEDLDDIVESILDKNEDGGVEKGEEEDVDGFKASLDFDIDGYDDLNGCGAVSGGVDGSGVVIGHTQPMANMLSLTFDIRPREAMVEEEEEGGGRGRIEAMVEVEVEVEEEEEEEEEGKYFSPLNSQK